MNTQLQAAGATAPASHCKLLRYCGGARICCLNPPYGPRANTPFATLRIHARLPGCQLTRCQNNIRRSTIAPGPPIRLLSVQSSSRHICSGLGGPASNGDGTHNGSYNGGSTSSLADGSNSSNGATLVLEQPQPKQPLLQSLKQSLQGYFQRLQGLQGKFLPMVSLFFFLSFINTILDSLKDTLVITAVGGGTHVIPYLTVYAVLPSSFLFLAAYTWGSQHYSRETLFNAIIGIFMAFFVVFAFVLFPNAAKLHPHGLADALEIALPNGLAGAVGMLRNWTYTLFFCLSELWGDVCMGLLFWGLANDTTLLRDASTLYPLFGLGANVAQALAGVVLKATTRAGRSSGNFVRDMQASMMVVLALSVVVVIAHHRISVSSAADAAAAEAERQRLADEQAAAAAIAGATATATATAAVADSTGAANDAGIEAGLLAQRRESSGAASTSSSSTSDAAPKGSKRKRKAAISDTMQALANSLEIRCLAVMSLAQGLCTSLMEFTWKCHMHILYPSPSQFTACLGDVATWTGLVTAALMFTSPLLFDRLGWRGVANATPRVFMWGGTAFFAACIAYQHFFGAAAEKLAAAGVNAVGAPGGWLLQVLVAAGALLFVFSKGAKFSMFKPAEEMVYITMDEEGRTKGKAAIDVVGAQTGKASGSLLQQVLLISTAGSIVGVVPILFVVFFAMVRGWRAAVDHLAARRDYSHARSHPAAETAAPAAAAAGAGLNGVGSQEGGAGGVEPLPAAAAGA